MHFEIVLFGQRWIQSSFQELHVLGIFAFKKFQPGSHICTCQFIRRTIQLPQIKAALAYPKMDKWIP